MPADAWSGYHRFCPLARALDVVGERWTLVIAHELLRGPRRYGQLQRSLPGVGTSLLADRLRKLEHAGVVERRPGESGSVVTYQLTESGCALAPAMQALREWGVRFLYEPTASATGDTDRECFDVTFVEGFEQLPDEDYEWDIDGEVVTLRYRDGKLCREHGPSTQAAVHARTTSEFMRRWAAGDTTWQQGEAEGEVKVNGTKAAWRRMLAATGYVRTVEEDRKTRRGAR